MADHNDDLLTADDLAAFAAEEADGSIDVFVDELPTTALRVLLRDHLMWLFVGAGIAALAFMLTPGGWLTWLLRGALFLAGIAFSAIRLFQINGIIMELKRRAEGGEAAIRDRTPPGPRIVRDDET